MRGDQRNEDLLFTAVILRLLLQTLGDLLQHLYFNIIDQNLLKYKQYEAEKLALKMFQVVILKPYKGHMSNFELGNIQQCINECFEFLRKMRNIHLNTILNIIQISIIS